jgi:Recombinase
MLGMFGLGLTFEQWCKRRELVRRLRVGRDRARRRKPGYHDGPLPFGARRGEKRIIQEIQALRSVGMSYRAIADDLNRAGVRARRARWHPTTIARILRREELHSLQSWPFAIELDVSEAS